MARDRMLWNFTFFHSLTKSTQSEHVTLCPQTWAPSTNVHLPPSAYLYQLLDSHGNIKDKILHLYSFSHLNAGIRGLLCS